MSFRYTNKLVNTITRYSNSKYSVCGFIIGQPILFNQIRYTRIPNLVHYSSVSKDIFDNSTLKNIKNARILDLKHFDKILSIKEIGNLSLEQRTILLQCYGKLLSNKSLDFRRQLCETVFRKLDCLNSLVTEDYNTYIKICTENEINIDTNNFFKSMKCEPNEETFKLLLENVCERGDSSQAYDVLFKMKEKEYAIDERTFNALVLTHTIIDGLEGANEVLTTMKAAQFSQSSDTNWNILLGLASRNNTKELLDVLETYHIIYSDDYFMKLLLKLCLHNKEDILPKVISKFAVDISSRQLQQNVEDLCIHLIHRQKAEIAVHLYYIFSEPTGQEYGRFLLEEFLETEMPSNEIISICKYLKDTERNTLALECVTEIALRKQKTERAWFFLKEFDKLRPHYFWPLLLQSAKMNGEAGVLIALEKMLNMGVQVDSETFELYILPYCDISKPKSFLLRTQHLHLSIRHILTPLLVLLLRNGQIKEANQLCNDYEVALDGSRLIHALALGWKSSKDVECILNILKRICETNETINVDFTGNLLTQMLKLSKNEEDYNEFLKFAKILHKEKLPITLLSGETIEQSLEKKENCNIKTKIVGVLDNLLDISMKEDESRIAHPKNMTIEQLECHLTELMSKDMKVRGVLQRLIQAHGRLGNYSRVQELRRLFEELGYEESPGVKAMLLQTYIKTNQSLPATEMYRELRRKHPGFNIDEYKLIDLAALLVCEDKFEVAMDLLKEGCQNRVVRSGVYMERNCVALLNSAKSSDQAVALFQFLTDCGFCKPKNVFLGPILRSYLKCNDLENAVNYYEKCCKEYKCTPLQVELLQVLVEAKNEELLKRVVKATATVYGSMKAQVSLAVALADIGKEKPLTKLLLEIKHIPDTELRNRCNKWSKDGKLESLLTIARVASRLKTNILNLDMVHLAIVRVFDNRNDCEGALNFIKNLKEGEVFVSQKVTDIVNNLVQRNKSFAENKMKL